MWALAWGSGGIYASAASSGVEEYPNAILARWDGAEWVELGVPARGLAAPYGESVHQFRALWARGDHVVAVGGVWPETGERNVFVFDGEAFTSLGGGVGAGSVDVLAGTPDALWFGGSIATTGTGDDLAPSVGIGRFRLAP